MDIVSIVDIFEKHGIKGALFIIFIFLMVSMFKSSWFSSLLSKISDKLIERFMKSKTKELNSRVITESDISNHDIFNYIDFWTYSKIPTFQFSTDYRTVVFRKYLTLYLRSYKMNLSKFVSNVEYQKMDDAKLYTSILNMLNMIVYNYEKECEEVGIPKIIIDKMKAKNVETIRLTMDLVESICNSQFYSSDKNFLKVYSILNILLSILENTISNSEGVCNSINGALRGQTFNDSGKTYIEP
jgi:hypothetical protein